MLAITNKLKLKSNWVLLAILVFAFILRFGYALHSYNNNVMADFADDKQYMRITENVLENGVFALNIESTSKDNKISYGLPWLMALFMFVFGKSWLVLFIVNALISTLSLYIIYLLCKKLFNDKIGIIAIIIGTFYIQYLKYIPTAGKEPWVVFLFLLTFYLFIKNLANKKLLKNIVFFSLSFSLLIHVDERYFSYFPLLVVLLILFNTQSRIKGLKKSMIYGSLVLLLMIPWTIRNYIVHEKIIVLSPRTEKITDKILGYDENQKVRKTQKVEDTYRYLTAEQIDSVIHGTKTRFKYDIKIPKDQVQAMQDGIIPHKFNRMEKTLSTLEELWRPIDLKREYEADGFRYNGIWSLKHNLSVGLTYGVVLILSLFGIILLLRDKNKWGIIFLVVIFYHTFIIHVLFMGWAQARYRLPIDFMLIISASYFIYYVVKRYAPNRTDRIRPS